MKVVSIINYKGGVGKTTITANIGSELAHRGLKVLLIDLDPQTNLTFSFIKVENWQKDYENNKTIKFWFDAIINGQYQKEQIIRNWSQAYNSDEQNIPTFNDIIVPIGDLDLICSHLGLINVDIDLAPWLSKGSKNKQRYNFLNTYSFIRDELHNLKKEYDLILFDCPPNFGIVTKNAILASDFYVIPSKMDYLSTLGINHLRNYVDLLVNQYNSLCRGTKHKCANTQFLGVIATMVDLRKNVPIAKEKFYIDGLLRAKIPLFSNMIRENKNMYSDAPENGVPVVLRPSTKGTSADVIAELKALAQEFKEKVGC